jgi:multiple sugar transport system permease protein
MWHVRWVHYLMVAPAHLLLLVFIVIPAGYVGWLSLHQASFGAPAVYVGLLNYIALLNDPIFWRSFWNTFAVVNVVVYGELAMGLGVAMLLGGWVPCKRLVIAILLAPYAVTEVTGVIMWRYMLEPDVGMIQYALKSIGLPQIDWSIEPVQALAVVAFLAIWQHLPFTFLILYAAVTTIPNELVESAKMDGASPWQTFWHVKLPIMLPAIFVAVIFRYIFAMRIFSEVWLLTEGGPARMTEVLAVYLYRQAFRYHEFGAAAATGWAMLLLSLLVALPYLRIVYKRMFVHG